MMLPEISVPPEWSKQAALMVGWPHLQAEWGDAFDGARAEIAAFAQAVSHYVPVYITCGSDEAEASARHAIGAGATITVLRIPTGDIWLRDTGPIIAQVGEAAAALTFRFNGWGGKYVMSGDIETAAALSGAFDLPVHAHDFVLEGGAVELDGTGRLLTTRQCLLNPNRNPGWTEDRAEAALKEALGVGRIIWLERGLAHDHTDGHVDNLARFVGPGHVLCQAPSGPDDPNAGLYLETEAALRNAELTVSTLPSPGRIGDNEPASHMNFVITNGAVFLPIYEKAYAQAAVSVLRELFPSREIVALPARQVLSGGGSFHCMTREIPRFAVRT